MFSIALTLISGPFGHTMCPALRASTTVETASMGSRSILRPTGAGLLVKVAPEIGNRNVTLAGFRAFQVKSFYFPNSEAATKNIQLVSGLALAIPSMAFLLSSGTVWNRKQDE